MNFEQQPKMDDEALKIHKEIFMTSAAIRVGQSLSEHKTERGDLWNKMHPPTEEVVEIKQEQSLNDKIDDQKSASESDVDKDLQKQIIKDREVEDQKKLEKVRQELGINSPNEGQFEKEKLFKKQIGAFIEVVIKDDGFRKLMDKWRNTRFAGESEDDFKKEILLVI